MRSPLMPGRRRGPGGGLNLRTGLIIGVPLVFVIVMGALWGMSGSKGPKTLDQAATVDKSVLKPAFDTAASLKKEKTVLDKGVVPVEPELQKRDLGASINHLQEVDEIEPEDLGGEEKGQEEEGAFASGARADESVAAGDAEGPAAEPVVEDEGEMLPGERPSMRRRRRSRREGDFGADAEEEELQEEATDTPHAAADEQPTLSEEVQEDMDEEVQRVGAVGKDQSLPRPLDEGAKLRADFQSEMTSALLQKKREQYRREKEAHEKVIEEHKHEVEEFVTWSKNPPRPGLPPPAPPKPPPPPPKPSPPPPPPLPPPPPPSPPPPPLPPPPSPSPPPPPRPPPPLPPPPNPPPPPNVCLAQEPCGENAYCYPDPRSPTYRYKCKCKEGYRGNPESNGPDKCRDEQQLYLEELFGMNKCSGCKFARPLLDSYRKDYVTRVLDIGTGACGTVRMLRQGGLDARGVEAVSFPLEDRCQDLLESGVVEKSSLDDLPFQDNTFDLVTAFNVLEYIPRDRVDSVIRELARVSKMRVFLVVGVPDLNKDNMGYKDPAPETLFPEAWWEERLHAHGLTPAALRRDIFMSNFRRLAGPPSSGKKGKKSKGGIQIESTEAVLTLSKDVAKSSMAAMISSRTECRACSYMPIVYYMYSPPKTVLKAQRGLKLGKVLVVGPGACNLVRGMKENRAPSLKEVIGLSPSEYEIEVNCPELAHGHEIEALDSQKDPMELPFEDGQFDIVLSLYHLELMGTADDVQTMMLEYQRVSTKRVFALINTCGSRAKATSCLAKGLAGVQIVESHAAGFADETMGHVFNQRPCKNVPLQEAGTEGPIHGQYAASKRIPMCESVYEEMRVAGAHELRHQDMFTLLKPERPPKRRGGALATESEVVDDAADVAEADADRRQAAEEYNPLEAWAVDGEGEAKPADDGGDHESHDPVREFEQIQSEVRGEDPEPAVEWRDPISHGRDSSFARLARHRQTHPGGGYEGTYTEPAIPFRPGKRPKPKPTPAPKIWPSYSRRGYNLRAAAHPIEGKVKRGKGLTSPPQVAEKVLKGPLPGQSRVRTGVAQPRSDKEHDDHLQARRSAVKELMKAEAAEREELAAERERQERSKRDIAKRGTDEWMTHAEFERHTGVSLAQRMQMQREMDQIPLELRKSGGVSRQKSGHLTHDSAEAFGSWHDRSGHWKEHPKTRFNKLANDHHHRKESYGHDATGQGGRWYNTHRQERPEHSIEELEKEFGPHHKSGG